MWAGIFVVIGVSTFLASFVQSSTFALMGARLARRVRMLTLTSLMRQVGFLTALPTACSISHPRFLLMWPGRGYCMSTHQFVLG